MSLLLHHDRSRDGEASARHCVHDFQVDDVIVSSNFRDEIISFNKTIFWLHGKWTHSWQDSTFYKKTRVSEEKGSIFVHGVSPLERESRAARVRGGAQIGARFEH